MAAPKVTQKIEAEMVLTKVTSGAVMLLNPSEEEGLTNLYLKKDRTKNSMAQLGGIGTVGQQKVKVTIEVLD